MVVTTTKRTKSAAQILEQGAMTYRVRNAHYRNNYHEHGDVMKALFPVGVKLTSPEDQARFGVLTQCVAKLTRYAAQWPKGHADSAHDLMVYAAMLEELTP